MKRIKIIIALIVTAVIATTGAVTVKNLTSGKAPEPEKTSKVKVTDEKGEEQEIVLTSINPLTGIDDLSEEAIGKRPVAIMINNIKKALPQYGILDADIMFEIPVEGGITRMMALYADYTKVPDVCSIRSCRYYFPVFAHGFDAVYFCFGSNQSLATPMLQKLGIDYFDGNVNYDQLVFGRDPDRLGRYSSEHTAYVKGSGIPALLEKYSIRTDRLTEKNEPIFKFSSKVKMPEDAAVCEKLNVKFSSSYFSTFNYNAESGTYLKQHSGNPHMDQRANKQLEFKNLFILETTVSLHENGPLVDVDWKGGTGYYITKGKAQKITWEKPTAESNIRVLDATGKEISVNEGKSYFAVVNPGRTTIKANETPASS